MQAPDDAADSDSAPTAPIVEHDLGLWREFLSDEDIRCRDQKLQAAVATVGVAEGIDIDEAVSAIVGVLRSTDRIGVLSSDELSVVLCPLADIHQGQRVVVDIERALVAAGLVAHVGWAMRLADHGFFHAAARADGRMLTAKGHGTFSVDVTDKTAVADLTDVTDLTERLDLTEADADAGRSPGSRP